MEATGVNYNIIDMIFYLSKYQTSDLSHSDQTLYQYATQAAQIFIQNWRL